MDINEAMRIISGALDTLYEYNHENEEFGEIEKAEQVIYDYIKNKEGNN